MYFHLPAVSFSAGLFCEFEGLPVRFADNKFEFLHQARDDSGRKPEIYNLDFGGHSPKVRMAEYRTLVRRLSATS